MSPEEPKFDTLIEQVMKGMVWLLFAILSGDLESNFDLFGTDLHFHIEYEQDIDMPTLEKVLLKE